MQFVTVEVCASRISADAALAAPSIAEPPNATANKMAKRRMTALPDLSGDIITPPRRRGNVQQQIPCASIRLAQLFGWYSTIGRQLCRQNVIPHRRGVALHLMQA